jgi:hypothetical protein
MVRHEIAVIHAALDDLDPAFVDPRLDSIHNDSRVERLV